MNIEELHKNCLAVKGAEENIINMKLVSYKVMEKVFAFFSLEFTDNEPFIVLKCNPEKSAALREKYKGVTKGYYTGNTLTWNSVYIQKDVPDNIITELIHHSVDEVIHALPKYKQKEYFEKESTH